MLKPFIKYSKFFAIYTPHLSKSLSASNNATSEVMQGIWTWAASSKDCNNWNIKSKWKKYKEKKRDYVISL